MMGTFVFWKTKHSYLRMINHQENDCFFSFSNKNITENYTILPYQTLQSYFWYFVTDLTKINRPVHNKHMHWTNFRQPTDHVQQNIFAKTPIEVCSPHLLRFFWHRLRQNWSFFRGTVRLWSMFENRQIAVFEGKCRRFRNFPECLKTHCGANDWPIWTQKVPKEA